MQLVKALLVFYFFLFCFGGGGREGKGREERKGNDSSGVKLRRLHGFPVKWKVIAMIFQVRRPYKLLNSFVIVKDGWRIDASSLLHYLLTLTKFGGGVHHFF